MIVGARSPGGDRGGSPRQKPLPLKVDALDEYDVSLLSTLMFSPNVASPITEDVDNQDQFSGCLKVDMKRSSSIQGDLHPMALRVYMHGWEGPSECVRTYTTFTEQVRV